MARRLRLHRAAGEHVADAAWLAEEDAHAAVDLANDVREPAAVRFAIGRVERFGQWCSLLADIRVAIERRWSHTAHALILSALPLRSVGDEREAA